MQNSLLNSIFSICGLPQNALSQPEQSRELLHIQLLKGNLVHQGTSV
jgi:hypothetical protein